MIEKLIEYGFDQPNELRGRLRNEFDRNGFVINPLLDLDRDYRFKESICMESMKRFKIGIELKNQQVGKNTYLSYELMEHYIDKISKQLLKDSIQNNFTPLIIGDLIQKNIAGLNIYIDEYDYQVVKIKMARDNNYINTPLSNIYSIADFKGGDIVDQNKPYQFNVEVKEFSCNYNANADEFDINIDLRYGVLKGEPNIEDKEFTVKLPTDANEQIVKDFLEVLKNLKQLFKKGESK